MGLPFLGGIIIALATTIMLFFNGRITGISGILGNSLSKPTSEKRWQYSFLIGLIIGGAILLQLSPQLFQFEINFSYQEAIIAGLLVGFGTRLGSGCTSGHGVCGLPRLSVRSLVATLTFMGAGIITVLIRSFS
ncbi:hypothetical protein A9Q84_14105 [Halobacteriovorax marinus]|uniref:Uncharacterized protein n=1 Tax=Halobacteriovorax marinus TaxID=97084 RepID=A0A1Y5FA51_9BACT|nr:hypothetical protein A9Q84_14105 [Halobacteriovorax marinus]